MIHRRLVIVLTLAMVALGACSASFHLERGFAHVEHGRYEQAIADYDEAIRLQPDYANAYHKRGVAQADLGRYAEAISDLETALELAQAVGDDDLAATIEEALEAVRNS